MGAAIWNAMGTNEGGFEEEGIDNAEAMEEEQDSKGLATIGHDSIPNTFTVSHCCWFCQTTVCKSTTFVATLIPLFRPKTLATCIVSATALVTLHGTISRHLYLHMLLLRCLQDSFTGHISVSALAHCTAMLICADMPCGFLAKPLGKLSGMLASSIGCYGG
eukprot:GHRR01027809.1.p2 GENE.GHRR01027809.1~~GHRR01027809.1.p2  ORF type:complete len:162 (-),score=29.88 GHRR01027809.1:171-656(-)